MTLFAGLNAAENVQSIGFQSSNVKREDRQEQGALQKKVQEQGDRSVESELLHCRHRCIGADQETAAHAGRAEQHRRKDFATDACNLRDRIFAWQSLIAVVGLNKNEKIIDSDGQHQKRYDFDDDLCERKRD